MSRQRNDDSKQNDWSKWLYLQGTETGSFNIGQLTFHDIDTIGHNYRNGKLIIIETKEHFSDMTFTQRKVLEIEYRIHTASYHPLFCGCHLLQFENTSPDNGFTLIRSFDGNQWRLLKEDISSSLQIQQWYKERML